MKKWLAFIACMAVASLNVWAQGEPTAFSLNPAVNRAQAGTTFSVDLRLTTAQALFKATARVASNNPKVTIKDVVFPAYPDNVATKKTVISNTERIVGAETMFTKLFDAGFDGVIATVVFEVAHDANADETAALTLSVDRYQTANVGCYAVATSQKLASALNNAALTVVQFNAPPLAGAATEDAAEPTVLTPVFTGDGASAAGGVISGVFFDYPEGGDEATHGAFAVSADKKSILYTAPTRVGNIRPFDVVAIYAARSGDLVDRNTVTVTVAPVNDPPEVAFVPPVNVNENDPIVFTITVVDEENGDFDFVVYWLDGNDWIKVPGNWAGLTFTSAEAPGYDAVMHPNLAKEVILKVEAIDRYDNQSTESAPTPATIHDVDQPVGAPTNVAITPDPAYTTSELNVNFTDAVDPDPEDAVNYTYKWTNDKNATTLDTRTVPPGMAKKGETWTVVVTANSFNGDRKDSDPAQITISNSLPIVDDGELFIQKGDNLPKSKDIDLAELAGDRDGQEDITEIVIVTLPAKGTLALKDGTVYTYTVDGDDEFFGENVDIFEFRAKDASGGESIEIAKVAVTYRALPFCRRADGGAFNEQPIDHHNYTVFAMPGDIIQGTAWVEVNNTLPAEEKVTLVGTVTWGDRTTQYWDTKVLPVGESFQSVSLGYQVPDAPGDYYILIGYAKSDAVPQFMSSTHAGRDAVWNDGNDLGFDWNEGQFEQALSNEGRVTANILQLDGQFKEEQVPVTAIHIRVTSEVNVTFVVDQGDEAPVPESKTVTIGAPYGDLPFSSREGHRFLGWWTAREGGSEVTPETIVTVKANHSLYAQWAVESYTLTFDSAGGSDVDPITQEYNTIVTPPADPTREGHTFDGWEPAVPKTMPAADMTLTALWTPIQYIVTFELGNCGYRTGGGELEQLVNHGDSATAPIVTTMDGWDFIGWDRDFTKIVEPTEINAQYQLKQYIVTFELGNCGYRTGGGELEQLINHGDSATAPIVTTYDGWEFIGWDKDFTKIVEPTEIQAQYQPKKYAVTFNLGEHGNRTGGGELEQLVEHGASAIEPIVAAAEGWDFTGWDKDFTKIVEPMEINAQYQLKKQHAVTFNLGEHGNHAGGGELEQLVNHGESAIAPEVTAADGWEFIGWDKDFTKIVEPMTVSALYQPRPLENDFTFSFSLQASWTSGVNYTLWMLGSPNAKDDYDASDKPLADLELPPLPAPSGEEAFFQLPDSDVKLLWDAHFLDDTVDVLVWTLLVDIPEEKTAELTWDNSKIPEGWRLTIAGDNAKIHVDMEVESSLVIEQSGLSTFVVTAIRADLYATAAYDLNIGWNIISLPLEMTQPSKAYLRGKKLWSVDTERGSYQQVANVIPGKAYWFFSHANQEITLDGLKIQDPGFNLKRGWNFVAPAVDMEISVDDIVAWRWEQKNYLPPEVIDGKYQLLAKKGYWIFNLIK